jgi:hypothetical protein
MLEKVYARALSASQNAKRTDVWDEVGRCLSSICSLLLRIQGGEAAALPKVELS